MFEDVASLSLSVKSGSVAKASGRLDRLEKESRQAERAGKNVGRSFGSAGSRLARFAVQAAGAYVGFRALTATIRTLVKVNMEFEETLSGVEAVTRGTTEQMENMEGAARKLGATTMWSASQAAEGMRFLGMAGFEVNEIIETMPGLLDLATAGALDLGRAADIASNIMSGFGLAAAESGRVADVLAATASSANTSVEQLGEGMKFVAPIAASMNIEIEQASATMGVLSDAGLQASMAGTSLRTVLAALVSPTSEAQAAIESYGLSVEDVSPASNNLIDIIERLSEVNLSAADAFDIFGRRGAPAIFALTSQTARLRELSDEMDNATGRAGEMADVMADNLAGDVKILQSAFQELLLATGDRGITGALRDFTQEFGAGLQDINKAQQIIDLAPLVEDLTAANLKVQKVGESAMDVKGSWSSFTFLEAGKTVDNIDKMEERLNSFIEQADKAQLGVFESQVGSVIDKQSKKLEDLRAWAAEGGDNLLFGTRSARLDQVDVALAKLKELREIQKNITDAQPAAEAAAAEVAEAEAEAAAEAQEKQDQAEVAKRKMAEAKREAERQENLEKVHKSLRDEEEIVRDSYERRRELVLQNTEEESEARHELLEQIREAEAEELATIEDSAQHKARIQEEALARKARKRQADLEKVRDSLKTEEELIRQAYERQRQVVIDGTEETSAARAELLEKLNTAEEGELEKLEERQNQALETIQDRLNSEYNKYEEFYSEREAQAFERAESDQEILEEALDRRQITEQEHLELSKERWRRYMLDVNEIVRLQAIKSQKEQLNNYQTVLGMTGDITKELEQMAEEGSAAQKALFYASKGIAIAQAIINTELAATRALAEGGFIMGIPMATAIRALGYASVGLMAGQTIAGSFADGGNIPAGKTGLVGEAGPEIIQGPAQVTSARDTKRALTSPPMNFSVVVNNNAPVQVETAERDTPDGKIVDIMIRQTEKDLAAKVGQGGSLLTKQLERTYGLRRSAS